MTRRFDLQRALRISSPTAVDRVVSSIFAPPVVASCFAEIVTLGPSKQPAAIGESGMSHLGRCGTDAHFRSCAAFPAQLPPCEDRKSTRLNSSHITISYAVFCLKKKK